MSDLQEAYSNLGKSLGNLAAKMDAAHSGHAAGDLGERCADCSLPYSQFELDTKVSDNLWKAIAPKPNGGGLLCANCIIRRVHGLFRRATVADLRFAEIEHKEG